jgi:glucosamine-6-phosphate deaminase
MTNDLAAFEKIPVKIFTTSEQASISVANEIAARIKATQKENKPCVLGLATGSTPTRVYAELVRMHKEGLSFKNVHTFNLDEYYPMQPESFQSYVRFMNEHLFNHIDIPKKQIHIPDGLLQKEKVAEFCRDYEKMIDDLGGIDIQVLGIGRTGHIGFNEPGSTEKSLTRLVTLDQVTRIDAASDFFGEENVPRKAITMGVGSIMKARKCFMMAWGEGKAAVIKGRLRIKSRLHSYKNIRIVLWFWMKLPRQNLFVRKHHGSLIPSTGMISLFGKLLFGCV